MHNAHTICTNYSIVVLTTWVFPKFEPYFNTTVCNIYNYGSQREREFLVLGFFEFLVSRREMEDEKREIVAFKQGI